MAFDFDAYNSVTGPLSIQLFSLLPGVSAASGLKAAAAASKVAQRTKPGSVNTSNIEIQGRLAEQRANNYQRLSGKLTGWSTR